MADYIRKGISHRDDTAFSIGNDTGTPTMGLADDTGPDSVDEGDVGVVRMSARRELYVQVRDAQGNERGLRVDANGAIAVTGSTGGVTHTDDAAFTPGTDDVVPAAGVFDDTAPDSVDEGDAGALRMSANRNLYVRIRDNAGNERGLNIDASGRALVDASGVAVPVTDNAASLTVDNPALSVTGGGVEATALRVTLASDSTGVLSVDDNGGALTVDQATAANLNAEVQGDAAHDAAASGNPVLVGAQMETMADSAPGTRSSTDGDATKLATADGALFVITTGPQTFTYNAAGVLTGAQVHAAPGAGLAVYITDIHCSIGAATASSIKLLMNAGADIWGPHYLEAVNGRGVAVHFGTPLKATANGRVDVTTTGAATQSTSIQGFIAPG